MTAVRVLNPLAIRGAFLKGESWSKTLTLALVVSLKNISNITVENSPIKPLKGFNLKNPLNVGLFEVNAYEYNPNKGAPTKVVPKNHDE